MNVTALTKQPLIFLYSNFKSGFHDEINETFFKSSKIHSLFIILVILPVLHFI